VQRRCHLRSRAGLCAALLLALAGCAAGPDHEGLGDRRYAERAFVDALAEYRLAMQQRHPDYELRAKYAQAALRSGALEEAVGAYRDLARAEPGSVDEAADGLMRAAELAIGARDMTALSDAVVALREIAPHRDVGALAVALGVGSSVLVARRPEAIGLLLAAAAAAPTAAGADSFLVAYADAGARLGRCDAAARVYQGVLRRAPLPAMARAARGGLAGCALDDGKLLLSAGSLHDAEARFRQAVAIGEPDSIVRLAWLLIGDARWADGDTVVALDAYQHAAAGAAEGDPVAARATDQMNRLLGKGATTP
jgi:tetratricopeptide (TPR) repeat protein